MLKIISNPNETMEDIRSQLLFLILITINILGVPALIIGAIEAVYLKQYYTAISYFVFYTPIFFVTIFRKKISYKTTTKVVILFIYLIAVTNIVIYGFSGAGIPIFLTMFVITTIFIDLKAGLIAVFICLISMMVIGFLYLQNIISLGISLEEITTYPISWITASAVLSLLGCVIVLSFGIIQKKMMLSVQNSNNQAKKLSILNVQLDLDIKKRKRSEEELLVLQSKLELKVIERTKKLQEKVLELENFYEATINREYRMVELRDEIEELKKKLEEK